MRLPGSGDRHGTTAGGRLVSCKRSDCKKLSHSTDACDLSTLSGIAGNQSGHPIRTRSVLADAAGTARAVVPLLSGTLARRCGLPCRSAGIAATRGPCRLPVSAGLLPAVAGRLPLPESGALRRAPVLVSRGMAVPLPGADHRCLTWRRDHSTPGYRPTMYPKVGTL